MKIAASIIASFFLAGVSASAIPEAELSKVCHYAYFLGRRSSH